MNILVGYDGSNVARAALDLAKQHAKAFNGTIHIVSSMVGGPEIPRRKFADMEKELDYQKALCREEKIPCETLLSVRGLEAGEDLVTYARERGIDEIVIGVRKRSKVGKLLFGSTAQAVILEANCPVVTVR